MLRYSLSALFIAVFVVALFCAALAHATLPWLELVKVLTYFVLLSAVVAVLVSKGRAKVIASGMAVFGWGFVYLVQYPSTTSMETAIDWVHDAVHGRPPEPRQLRPAIVLCGMDDSATPEEDRYGERYLRFCRIMDMGLTLVSSILGGSVGLFFHFRSGSPRAD